MYKQNKKNTLGFCKPPSETRVLVAMSGGVDSSVVAAMLSQEGYEVIGITLQLYDHGAALARKGACCAGSDINDAQRVAEKMQFPHYTLNYENIFREAVIDEFVDSYINGTTPIPCIRCNERVKFNDLLQKAKELEADCMATGHYIKRKIGFFGPELHRADDLKKDQSYFLFSTTKEQLEFLRFPLGQVNSKRQTRELAAKFDLKVADKPDSQDICFVPDGNYAKIIQKLHPLAMNRGEILDSDGNLIGEHKGIINYTIGQRRGLGVGGLKEPMFVISIDAKTNRITVGPKDMLKVSKVFLSEINWLGDTRIEENSEFHLSVKLRSNGSFSKAILRPLKNNKAQIELFEGQEGIAAGQACVFYDTNSTRILGGGWITNKIET